MIHVISCVRQRKCIKVNIIQMYIVIWLLYVGLYSAITGNVEGAADKPCGEAVQTLTQKHVVKRYIIAQKVVPLHYASE